MNRLHALHMEIVLSLFNIYGLAKPKRDIKFYEEHSNYDLNIFS